MSEKCLRLPLPSTSLFASLLSLGLALWSVADPGQAVPSQNGSEGIPLPAGARMRIGSTDLRPHARALVFSPDGSILATIGDHTHLWDVATGKHLRELCPRPRVISPARNSILFSRDGATLLGIASERTLASWDVATGDKSRTIYTADAGMGIYSLLASPDGNQLVVEIGKIGPVKEKNADLLIHQLQLWDLTQSNLVRSFQKAKYHPPAGGAYWGNLAFAPDGKTIAAADDLGIIVLWDVATGKMCREIPAVNDEWAVSSVAFSADSRALLSSDCRNTIFAFTHGRIGKSLRVRDIATGKERFSIPGLGRLAMSPDGRMLALATGGWEGGGRIGVLELLTCEELLHFNAKKNNLHALVFAPDGNTLASATYGDNHDDVLIWGLTPRDWRLSADPPSADALRALWKTLSDDDASAAYRSVLTLSAHPAQSIPYLKERLSPIPVVRPERIRQLITDLDNNSFKRRQEASMELARLRPQAESALRAALAKSSSLELRRRLETLLKTSDEWIVKDPALLQTNRAIWVLQRIGTPEARVVLEKLAAGAPDARQTQEAKTAVQFLDRIKKR